MPSSLFQSGTCRALLSSASSLTTTTSRLFSSTARLANPPPRHANTNTSARLSSILKDREAPAGADSNVSASDIATRMLARRRTQNRLDVSRQVEAAERLREAKQAKDYLRQLPRRWQPGDVYSPRDLSSSEMRKWSKRSAAQGDLVDTLNLSPVDMYKNFSLIRGFTSSSGQILHSKHTKLRPVNQRKVAKMIRRAQGMGLYPSIHAHPEMLRQVFYSDTRF